MKYSFLLRGLSVFEGEIGTCKGGRRVFYVRDGSSEKVKMFGSLEAGFGLIPCHYQ
jgi:hypothetical protein